jgi:hypothetical protein
MKTPGGWSPIDDSSAVGPTLLTRAAGILVQEAAKIPASFLQLPSGTVPSGAKRNDIPGVSNGVIPSFELPVAALQGVDVDRLRRHAHDLIETFLTAFSPKASVDDRAVMLRCAAPVQAGEDAVATLQIANEDASPSSVSLYSSNFIADNGYDIAASRVGLSPRVCSLPAESTVSFEIKIRVPQQAPPGTYSGLVQASGSKYLKAVVSLEVK